MDRKSSFVALILFAAGCVAAVADGIVTLQNRSLFFPLADLATNGVSGLTNGLRRLLVSGVSSHSANGGSVTLVNTQVWVRRYDGPISLHDQALQVAIDGQGRVTVAGYSAGFASASDFATISYASDGTPLWTNRYDGAAHRADIARHVVLDDAGNAYVAGESKGPGNVNDLITIKYTADGTALWTNRYNEFGTNYHQTAAVALDANADLVVALGNFDGEPGHYTTLKYDALGAPLWTNYYRTSDFSSDHANAVAVDASRNVFITGTEFTTIKYSPEGMPLWTNRLPANMFGVPASLFVDRSGNVLVCGDAWTVGTGLHEYVTMKFSNDGAGLWTNRIGAPQYQGGGVPQVRADAADNVIIVGGTEGAGGDDADFIITRLRADGVPLWTNRFFESNAIGGAFPSYVAVDAAGNIDIATQTTGTGRTNLDFLTLKYSAGGTLLWSNRFDGSGFSQDYVGDLGVDDSGQVYVTGLTGGFFGGGDFATVKYAEYILYTPPDNFVGTDNICFIATDHLGRTATGVVAITVSPQLAFDSSPGQLQFNSRGFQMRVENAFGTNPVFIYASTNLVHWDAIFTNPPISGSLPFTFIDPAATNHAKRFYRAIQNP